MKTEQEHNNEQWRKVRFDQFFDMLPTNTLSRDKLNNQRGEYQNIHYGDVLIKYPYCLDCNVNDIPYINEGVRFNTAQVKDGDVIFADTAEDDTVGKCVEVLNVGDRKIVSGLHTYFCRPKHEMALGYLGYFLNSNHFHNQLLPYIAGSKVSSVNRTSIARTFIFYPESLPTQRRIAAILSSADKVIASTQKVIAKYKQMKQGMMEDLLKPKEGWEMVRLGEVALIVRGGSPRPIDSYITTEENGINWIKIGDIDVNGKYVEKTSEKILSEGKLYSREVHNGDFILSNSMSFGRPYIVKIDGCIHDGWLAIQNYEHVFDTDFLFYVLSSDMVKSQYSSMASGSTVLNLNKEKVAQVTIAVPSIVEQRRISKILSGIDKKIEAEQAILNKYTLIKKGLMEKLLNEKK